MNKLNIKVKINEKTIDARLTQLAKQITIDFKGEPVTLVCILRGGVVFMTDLAKKIDLELEYDFMEISSYGDSDKSSGIIRLVKDISSNIKDKNVIIIEDIIDTGITLKHLINHLNAKDPKSLKVCALLNKSCAQIDGGAKADYVGFEVGDEFIVGYGLDYAQSFRSLPYIGVILNK